MKPIVFLLFFVFIIPSVFPCGKKEKNVVQPVSAETVITEGQGTENMSKITGRVRIYGSEPHTFVGIVDERGNEFAVYPPEQEEKLRRLQGRLIEFTVIFFDEPKGEGGLYLKGGTVNPVEWIIIR
jgi:hypothetical protein